MSYIEWLDQGPLRRGVVGGKAAVLSELKGAGFPVPPGFAVTAAGYRRFASEAGVVKASAEALLSHVGEAELPAELASEIEQAYARLVSETGEACAVRSSAIAEDGAVASFAGLYETFLNVRGAAAVHRAVRRCYASLWSERALCYRDKRTAAEEQAMAVLIMSLVPADVSGVVFTANPVTGARNEVMINASWGLGESIVAGMVTPDLFLLEKDSLLLLERQVFTKDVAIISDEKGGTSEAETAPHLADVACITDSQAVEVARLAVRAEAHFGVPQDVEFAFADGRLFLLQSRPITTLS